MAWEVEFTDEFSQWWDGLNHAEQDAIDYSVGLLHALGPSLGRPHADVVKNSRHPNMKELRVQRGGKPYRIFFAFDPRRTALLLIGGCKAGDKRFYERMIPVADALYDVHLHDLRKEGLLEWPENTVTTNCAEESPRLAENGPIERSDANCAACCWPSFAASPA